MEDLLHQHRDLFITQFEKTLLTEDLCDNALIIASENSGFDRNYHKLLFQGGMREVIKYLSQFHDDKMLESLSKDDLPEKVTPKIALATKTRIKLMNKVVLQKICNFYTNPLYSHDGIKNSFITCSKIWKYAGDKSIDYNYYTKRILLLSVYLPSIMHYLGDESENYTKTDQFINSSLEKIVKFGSLKARMKLPKIEDIPILRMFI
jgi:ubiquinone biosynthesis protein COQ9